MQPNRALRVVDDALAAQESMQDALASRFTVHAAASTSAAEDTIFSLPWDLILIPIDHRVLDHDGPDLLRINKHVSPLPSAVLMTGSGFEAIAMRAFRGGRTTGSSRGDPIPPTRAVH
jgi:DNA-binding NtrC family response regulator